ncbi:MAG: D-Ala-D-Ala carboxypeptidase family metallohydrolase [Methanobrevibacter sp.]|nr:D-Ala-D-Ala carboxypeptidase family metallohydrolase [Methanobrevibacter sp.]
MTTLSNHFSYNELVNSPTAKRLGIDNTPGTKELIELKKLAVSVLEPIRLYWNAPVIVTSGYRCPLLNKAVKGVPTSQHVAGQAADIRTVSDRFNDNKKLFDLIKRLINEGKINVGQLIWEYGNDNGPDWIHVSIPTYKLKNQIFRKG